MCEADDLLVASEIIHLAQTPSPGIHFVWAAEFSTGPNHDTDFYTVWAADFSPHLETTCVQEVAKKNPEEQTEATHKAEEANQEPAAHVEENNMPPERIQEQKTSQEKRTHLSDILRWGDQDRKKELPRESIRNRAVPAAGRKVEEEDPRQAEQKQTQLSCVYR